MKAQELRIGNIVEYLIRDEMDAKKEWWEPSQIDAEDILWLSQNPDDEDYRPMPLTEEWLVRFGFNSGGQSSRLHSVFKIFKSTDSSYSLYAANDFTSFTKQECRVEIRWVHGLQNLYFALTGEELTTTPIQ